MKAPVAFPFRRSASRRVAILDWAFRPEPVGDLFPDWDSNTPIAVSVYARVDVAGVLADCGLPAGTQLSLSLVWASAGTNLRGLVKGARLNTHAQSDECVMDGQVDGANLSGALNLDVILHLAETHERQQDALSPRLVGSVLWRASRRLFVEGAAARFPVEAQDFQEISWLPSDAAWYLDWNPEEPSEALLGSLRLFVNSSHPKVRELLEADKPLTDTDSLLPMILRTDVARQLITGSLRSREFIDSESFDEGSVGKHVQDLLARLFPGSGVEQLAAELQQRPSLFESRLQAKLRFLQA